MWRRWFPVLEWLPRYKRADLSGDLVAGLTGAAILVPQSMAYATIAQLPPVVGLYASVVPLVVYAVFGRSRQLSVGPLASISILSAVGVAKLAPSGTERFVALAATLALLVGIVHISIGVLRLGFVMRFLSEPVMTGFLAAVGILLMCTQLGPMTGVSVANSGRAYDIVKNWLDVADGTSVATLALSIASILVLLALRHRRRFPSALVLVVVATAVSAIADFSSHGIAVVGSVPSGLAGFKVPVWHWHDIEVLLPTAFAITLISVLESLALGREYADTHGYEIDTNQEIVALGTSNVAAGFFQGMVVTGAITRSSILEAAGARTQLSGAISAFVVAPLLLFGTGLFEDIPVAVLSAIVVVAVAPFVKVREARRLWRVQRADFWVLMLVVRGHVGTRSRARRARRRRRLRRDHRVPHHASPHSRAGPDPGNRLLPRARTPPRRARLQRHRGAPARRVAVLHERRVTVRASRDPWRRIARDCTPSCSTRVVSTISTPPPTTSCARSRSGTRSAACA